MAFGERRKRQVRPWSFSGLADPGLYWGEIPPESCDPGVRGWREPHLVAYAPFVEPRRRLWVFLCGSYGIPSRHRLITAYAARLGYHAINLSYPNTWTVGGLCREGLDADCHRQVRLDILDGGGRSGLVPVAPSDSLLQRLASLVRYLADQQPGQGWGHFLTKGGLDWSAILVAGHSQGSGHAALIGKLYPVARVVMFSGPADQIRPQRLPAPWLSAPGATPASHYFGLVHRADPGFDKICEAWAALGMGADLSQVDSGPPPGGARCLVTDYTPVPRERYHNCLTQDQLTPRRPDGKAVFEEVWRYLFDLPR